MFVCEFNVSTSVRSDLFPAECGRDAEFRHAEQNLCEHHWYVETERVVVCKSCDRVTWESYSAWSTIHRNTCSLWAQGVDCMHGEGEETCECEDKAREALEAFREKSDEREYWAEVEIAEQHGDRVW